MTQTLLRRLDARQWITAGAGKRRPQLGLFEVSRFTQRARCVKTGAAVLGADEPAAEHVVQADVQVGLKGMVGVQARYTRGGSGYWAGLIEDPGFFSGELRFVLQLVEGSNRTWLQSVQITPNDPDAAYRVKLAVADGSQKAWLDGANLLSQVDTTLDGVKGLTAVYANIERQRAAGGNTRASFWRFRKVSDANEIVFRGLPTGWKMDLDGNVTVESGGVATLDVAGLDFPFTELQVKDGLDVVRDSWTPQGGIWPGSTWEWVVPHRLELHVVRARGSQVLRAAGSGTLSLGVVKANGTQRQVAAASETLSLTVVKAQGRLVTSGFGLMQLLVVKANARQDISASASALMSLTVVKANGGLVGAGPEAPDGAIGESAIAETGIGG